MESYTVNTILQRAFLNTWKRPSTNLLRQERTYVSYLCLQKIETCNYSRDVLLALQSCYLLPTIDKPKRVHIKKTWQGINELLNRCKRKGKSVRKLKDPDNNNNLTNDSSRIPNILNKQFFKCWQHLSKQITTGRAPLYRVPK